MYIEELQHFINCIKKRKRPLIGLQQGIDVLEIALAAKQASQQGKIIKFDQK